MVVYYFVNGLPGLVLAIVAGMLSYLAVSLINKPFSEKDNEFFKKIGIVGRFFGFFASQN